MSPIYRSPNRIVGGVCAALAQHWHMDVTLLRVLTALAALLVPGLGTLVLIAYIVLWAVLPEAPQDVPYSVDGQPAQPPAATPLTGKTFLSLPWIAWAAIALIALGLYYLIREITGFDLRPYVLPVGLIAVGILLLTRTQRPPKA